MNRSTRCLFFALVLLALAPAPSALETIYIVRHAEKDRDAWWDGPAVDRFRPLTERGKRRAQLWADHLHEAGIAAIYTSETTRTVHTGVPLAVALGIPLLPGNGSVTEENMGDFLRELTDEHQDHKAVLIIGHSNTIPHFLRVLGAERSCFKRLGFVPEGNLIKGNEGLWIVQLGHRGCRQIRQRVVKLEENDKASP